MKYLLLFILLTQSIIGSSQFYVGDSIDLAKSKLEEKKIMFTQSTLTDTTHRISYIIEDDYQMILLLNTDDIVTRQNLFPLEDHVVFELLEWFNKDFVIISDTQWRKYANGRIYYIHMKYLYDLPFFSITLSPNSE